MRPCRCGQPRQPVGVLVPSLRAGRKRRSQRRKEHSEAWPRNRRTSGVGLRIEPGDRSQTGTPRRKARKLGSSEPGVVTSRLCPTRALPLLHTNRRPPATRDDGKRHPGHSGAILPGNLALSGIVGSGTSNQPAPQLRPLPRAAMASPSTCWNGCWSNNREAPLCGARRALCSGRPASRRRRSPASAMSAPGPIWAGEPVQTVV